MTILPSDPRAGVLSPTLEPRSPPASFEDFVEETTAAILTEAAGHSVASPNEPGPLPQLAMGLFDQLATSSPKQNGKRVAPDTDEGPEHKRLHANRDSGIMVGRILAMAKVFAPPNSRSPSTTVPSLGITGPLRSSGIPVARSEVGPTTATDRIMEEEIPPRKSLPSPSLGEDQDNFSQEFDRLQEKVASEREVLEGGVSVPILPTGPDPSAPVLTRSVPETSSSALPTSPPLTGPRSNFLTEGLTGCPLEALSSLVTPEYVPRSFASRRRTTRSSSLTKSSRYII